MMKKLLALLSFLLVSNLAMAQYPEDDDIEISPTMGYTVSGGRYYATNQLESINVGILADLYTNKRWSLRTGLQYLTLGENYYQNGHWTSSRLSVINLPIRPNLHIGKRKRFAVNFGFNILTTLNAGIYNTDTDKEIKPINGKRVKLGIGIGFEYKYPISKNLHLGIMYDSFAAFGPYNSYENIDPPIATGPNYTNTNSYTTNEVLLNAQNINLFLAYKIENKKQDLVQF